MYRLSQVLVISSSFLSESPESALSGIREVVADVVQDMDKNKEKISTSLLGVICNLSEITKRYFFELWVTRVRCALLFLVFSICGLTGIDLCIVTHI